MADTVVLYLGDFRRLEDLLDVAEGLASRGISYEIKGKL